MRTRSLAVVALVVGGAAIASACGSPSSDGGPHGAAPPADSGVDAPNGGANEDGGPGLGSTLPGERLGPLPAQAAASTATFTTSETCATCHTSQAGSAALRDAAGRDVSPVSLWRGSMMAMAARDPYYLAVLEHELAAHPGAESTVMSACTRCHAPAAHVELAANGAHLSFKDLTSSTSSEALVGRDGVTCTACHQIAPDKLGTPESFTGAFVINGQKRIYGPHDAPFAQPMAQSTGYTPVASAHTRESGLCGTCHTVVTRSLDGAGAPKGPEVLEQGPFVEWSVSSFAKAGGKSCQDCHMPTTDDDGASISAVLSTRPPNRLAARSPFGRHTLTGSNAFMLRILARERSWAGIAVPEGELLAGADRAEASLRSAARVSLTSATREASGVTLRVRVENLTGHKLPTAYPSRRMWLHVTVSDASGAVRFESGRHRGGRLVDGKGAAIDGHEALFPHRAAIASSSDVQVWEAVPKDGEGHAAATLFDAVGYLKDNRILPAGFDASDARAALATPVGVSVDGDFLPASDEVTVRVAGAPPEGRYVVELLYQTARPAELDLLAQRPGPAALRFLDMVRPDAMEPITMARVEGTLP